MEKKEASIMGKKSVFTKKILLFLREGGLIKHDVVTKINRVLIEILQPGPEFIYETNKS